MNLDKLLDFILENGIELKTCKQLTYFKKAALYCSVGGTDMILLNENFNSRSKFEQMEILAEECGHYATTSGDMTAFDCDEVLVAKAELKARQWGADFLIDLEHLKKALKEACTLNELLNELDVSYEILNEYLKKLSLQMHYLDLGDGQKLDLYKLPSIVKRGGP